jgi:hypothetical protein
MSSWRNAISTILLATMAGGSPTQAAPGAGQGETSPEPKPRRVKAPRLQDSRLPPLTWNDLAQATPLTPDEEELPLVRALAHRFNPAMALPTRDIWPVEVRYAWHDGSPLRARVVSTQNRVLREYTALPHERLAANDWGDLPTEDEDGNRIDYYVDAPGDDRMEGDVSGWRKRWRAIMNPAGAKNARPSDAPYKPTQYVHFFWFNREKGLLAIQYWFYYPYNEWINHHEGDWERINVVLRGPSRLTENATFHPVGYQFFFHLWTYEPAQVVRTGGTDPREDHVVVYAGGHSRFFMWTGSTSGGSYPLPAVFPGAGGGVGPFRPADDTTHPARFVRPEEFTLILLPEPDRVDVGQNPELAWLRLSFFAGQPHMYRNPLALNTLSFGGAPQQPARQTGWDAEWHPPYWAERPQFDATALTLPKGWQAVVEPPLKAYEAVGRRLRVPPIVGRGP